MILPADQLPQYKDTPFNDLPELFRLKIFGEEYARLDLEDHGEMYITRVGWSRMPAILPDTWYHNRRYADKGNKLEGGTGAVYRVDCPAPHKPNLQVVVKFARSGEQVPLHVAGTFPGHIPQEEIAHARWNSPFEEFGLVRDLRLGRYGSPDLKIMTKRPLAIYCPPNEFKQWQLGRSSSLWQRMEMALQRAQQSADGEVVHLHSLRVYVMLFEWVNGENAEDCYKLGLITKDELRDLTIRVTDELSDKGFRVLDNKPRHFILRIGPDGLPIRRNGQLVYTLIDFELLIRTPEYESWLRDKAG